MELEAKMMRDKRKNEEYFKSYIAYQNERIEKKVAKLNECNDDAKAGRIRVSLLKYELDLLVAEFSAGFDNSKMTVVLNESIDIANKLINIDYENLLLLLSFSVLLEKTSSIKTLIAREDRTIKGDSLLNFLAEYLCTKKRMWTNDFQYENVYGSLKKLDSNHSNGAVINDYLSSWYDKRKSFSWYEADKSNNDTYVGYWSFEAAALAKIYNLDDTMFIQSEYYPVL